VFAKVCTMEGTIGDGSVFIPLDLEKIGDGLEQNGFERYGNEVLYNGRTGQQIETDIFMGPTYYLRLKHMVGDKMHHRNTGPRDQLTQQPTSGRGKEGGLRIGEMERDVLLSYGFSQFVKESMMERSDKYTWAVCKSCGRIARYAPSQKLYECIGCRNSDISIVQTPYAFKLLVQELETMGITPRFMMDEMNMEMIEDEVLDAYGSEAEVENVDMFESVQKEMEGGMEEEALEEEEEKEDEEAIDDLNEEESQEGGEVEKEDEPSMDCDDDDLNMNDECIPEPQIPQGGAKEQQIEEQKDDVVSLMTDFSDDEIDLIQDGAHSTNKTVENQNQTQQETKKVIYIDDSNWNKRDHQRRGGMEDEEEFEEEDD